MERAPSAENNVGTDDEKTHGPDHCGLGDARMFWRLGIGVALHFRAVHIGSAAVRSCPTGCGGHVCGCDEWCLLPK